MYDGPTALLAIVSSFSVVDGRTETDMGALNFLERVHFNTRKYEFLLPPRYLMFNDSCH